MATIEELKADSERKMTSALKALHTELAAIRTGRATPSLLDQVKVDYYGTATPVNQLANVTLWSSALICFNT